MTKKNKFKIGDKVRFKGVCSGPCSSPDINSRASCCSMFKDKVGEVTAIDNKIIVVDHFVGIAGMCSSFNPKDFELVKVGKEAEKEIKDCPLCKSTAEVTFSSSLKCVIMCNNCKLSIEVGDGDGETLQVMIEKMTIEKWNRRTK